MKNFNKLFGGLFLAVGLLAIGKPSMAAGYAVAPKETFVNVFSTTISTVTPAISSNAVATAAFQPGAVYEVIQSSGAASQYFQMYDSTSTIGLTCGQTTNLVGSLLGPRFIYGSTTANTVTRLDPPLVFHNGLIVCDSAATGITSITYELGRGLSGN